MSEQHKADGPTSGGSVAREASSAVAWSFLNTVLGRFGTLAINVALARIVGPEGFGTFAVATLVLLAILSFNELGISLAIVRWPEDPSRIAPTVNTLSLGFSALLTVIAWLTAPLLAQALGDPAATNVIRVMSLAILVNGAVATPAAALQRHFRQRERLVIDQVNTWLGAGVALGTALLGLGAMSLAIGRIAGAAVSGVMFVRASPISYRFGFDRAVVRKLLAFGLPLAGSSIIVFAAGYADQIVIGSTLGAQALGYYVLAFNLASWPVSVFSQPLRSVAPAAFARLQGDSLRLNASLARVLSAALAVAVPACVFLSAAAEPIVQVVYGSAWSPAAVVLQWLALAAVTRIAYYLFYDFLVVAGRTVSILWTQVVWFAALVGALAFGAQGGLLGVSVACLLVAVLVMGPVYCFVLARQGIRPTVILRSAWLALVIGALLWAASRAIVANVSSAWWSLTAAALLAAVTLALLAIPHLSLIRQLRAKSTPV